MINRIAEDLSGRPFPIHNEKATQAAIEAVLRNEGYHFSREHRLSAKDIPDFMIDDIAIEVKIKGGRKEIFDQCMRYLSYSEVGGLVLVTARSIGDFTKLVPEGKQFRIVNLAASWL